MKIRRGLAALAAAPLIIVAGCSSDSTSDLAGDPDPTSPADSPSRTPEQGGALTQEAFFGAVTQAQLRAQTAHVSAEMSASGQRMTLEGDIKAGESRADSAMDITMSAPTLGEGLRMVLADEVMYLNLGQLTQGKFARVDLSDTSTPLGQLMAQLAGSADPSASLKAMERGITSFEATGEEQVDGVATTRYRVEVDLQEVLAAQGMANLPGAATAQLPKTVGYDIWVGEDDLIRRMSFSLGDAMTMTMDFTEWGEPVDISAPPRNQISKSDPFAGLGSG
jgi:hypothetical protein